MSKIRYTIKLRLLCFVLGPATLLMGIFFMLSDSRVFNVLANIIGFIGLIVMIILNLNNKFESEDEQARKSYSNSCAILLELLLCVGCLVMLISLLGGVQIILSPQLFAVIAGTSLIVLGVLFELFDRGVLSNGY